MDDDEIILGPESIEVVFGQHGRRKFGTPVLDIHGTKIGVYTSTAKYVGTKDGGQDGPFLSIALEPGYRANVGVLLLTAESALAVRNRIDRWLAETDLKKIQVMGWVSHDRAREWAQTATGEGAELVTGLVAENAALRGANAAMLAELRRLRGETNP